MNPLLWRYLIFAIIYRQKWIEILISKHAEFSTIFCQPTHYYLTDRISLTHTNNYYAKRVSVCGIYFQLRNSAVGDKRAAALLKRQSELTLLHCRVLFLHRGGGEKINMVSQRAQPSAPRAATWEPVWRQSVRLPGPGQWTGEWANANHANGASQTAWGCLRLQNTRHTLTLIRLFCEGDS
jgi:hypothetical protein